jgi:hypothetical protein
MPPLKAPPRDELMREIEALVRARLKTKAQHAKYDAFLKAGGKGCFFVPNVVKVLSF